MDSAFFILVEVLMAFIMVIVVLGNLFVIEAVCRHVRLRTIPNICITSLAVADLFVGLVIVPMYMYSVYADEFEEHSDEYTRVQNSLDIYFGAASILHLTLISLDRCYAISCPLRRRFLQKATVLKILASLWLVVIIPTVLYIIKVRYAQVIILIGYFLVPLIIIITSYTVLMISVKLSWKKMEGHRAQQKTKDFKLAKTIGVVVVVFIVTWAPFFVVVVAFVYPHQFKLHLTPGELKYFAYFVKFSQYAGSAFNPFIYAFREREFTRALQYLIRYPKHHRSLTQHLVGEAPTTRTSTRSLFKRLSKAFEKNEQIPLHRISAHADREKNKTNGHQHQRLTQVPM